MKAPYKIYTTPVGTYDTKHIPDLQDIIFIRKDYLLEKLKDLREYYFDLFRNTGMEEYNIRMTTMDYLINKMEEI